MPTFSCNFRVFYILVLCALTPMSFAQPNSTQIIGNAQGVEAKLLSSEALKSELNYQVYLPEQYTDNPQQRFPVVYWLHGSNGSSKMASRVVSRLFAAAIRAGDIPAMILVFPDGLKQSMWVNSKDGQRPMETVIVKELLPAIDTNYRTIASPLGRIVEGGSMGGYGAARLGFTYPHIFGAVSMLSAGPLQEILKPSDAPIVGSANAQQVLDHTYGGDPEYFRALSPWVLAKQYAAGSNNTLMLRIVVGINDPVHDYNQRFSEHLETLKISHTYQVLPNVGHSPQQLFAALRESKEYWMFFRQYLETPTMP